MPETLPPQRLQPFNADPSRRRRWDNSCACRRLGIARTHFLVAAHHAELCIFLLLHLLRYRICIFTLFPCQHRYLTTPKRLYTYLQSVLPSLLDLHSTRQLRESPPETLPQRPIVQIPQMCLERRIDQPLIILLRQHIHA